MAGMRGQIRDLEENIESLHMRLLKFQKRENGMLLP